jgi:hypothetical protein
MINLKSFIFEGKMDEIDENSIFEILEDIVTALAARIDDLNIVKTLSEYEKDIYLLKISINHDKVLLDIIFDISYIKTNEIGIKIQSSKSELGQRVLDNGYIYFNSVDDLKKQALKFIFETITKHINIENLRGNKFDFVSEFEQIYEEIFKKYGFKIRSIRKLKGSSKTSTKFIIAATDLRNTDVEFNVIIYPNNTFRIDLISNMGNLISKTINIENYIYDFKKALEMALYYLKEQYDLTSSYSF